MIVQLDVIDVGFDIDSIATRGPLEATGTNVFFRLPIALDNRENVAAASQMSQLRKSSSGEPTVDWLNGGSLETASLTWLVP